MLSQLETWEYVKHCVSYYNPQDFNHDDLVIDIYARFANGMAPNKAYIQKTTICYIIDEHRRMSNRLMRDYITWDYVINEDLEPASDDIVDKVYWKDCLRQVISLITPRNRDAVRKKLSGEPLTGNERRLIFNMRRTIAETFPEIAR